MVAEDNPAQFFALKITQREAAFRVGTTQVHPRRRHDKIAHEITWKEKSLDALKGEIIRLEFFLKNADLYSFRAQ